MTSVVQFNPHLPVTWERPDLAVLANHEPAAPSFPAEMLGEFWQEWCEGTAVAANAPFDFVAAGLLTVAGAMLGNSRVAQVGSWKEPPLLWTALIGEPSSNKSPALDSLTRMVGEIEEMVGETDFTLHDATPRATGDAAVTSHKGNLLLRDELAGWWGTFGSVGGEQFWLQAFGARKHSIRRANQSPLVIPRLAVSVLGGTQPSIARSILDKASSTGFASRLLYIAPSARRGFQLQQPLNDALAHDALARLFAIPVGVQPEACCLASDAEADLTDWVKRNIERCGEGGEAAAQWLGKQRGVALRLALIREYLTWAAEAPLASPPPSVISRESYRAACRFIDGYAEPMMLRALGASATPPEVRAAQRLIAILRKHDVTMFNAARVRRSELGPVGSLREPKTMQAACEVLEAACLIRNVGVRVDGRSGRKPQDFAVNPLALKG